jgi:large repetitive protein
MNGSLSPGLTLTSRGALSGKPTSAGIFTFAIQARDRYGRLGTQQYNLTIALPTVSLKSINAFRPNGGPLLQQDRYSERLR